MKVDVHQWQPFTITVKQHIYVHMCIHNALIADNFCINFVDDI